MCGKGSIETGMTRRERLYGMGRRGYEGGGGCASAARGVWRHDGGSSPGIRDARMPSSRSQLERYPCSYGHARHTGRGAPAAEMSWVEEVLAR